MKKTLTYLPTLILSLMCSVFAHGINIDGKERKVLLIGLDGLQYEILKNYPTPNLDKLYLSPNYTGGIDGDETEQETSSGPGWATVLTGVWANQHHITENNDALRSPYPSVFKRIKDAYPSATLASFAGWDTIHNNFAEDMKLVDHVGSYGYMDTYEETDVVVQEKTLEVINNEKADFIFSYISNFDATAHEKGYGKETAHVLDVVDHSIGELLAATAKQTHIDWVIIVASDHGRNPDGYHHGPQTVNNKTTFFATNKKEFHNEHLNQKISTFESLYSLPPQTEVAELILGSFGINLDKPAALTQYVVKRALPCNGGNSSWCEGWLSFESDNVGVYGQHNLYDIVPWEFVPVANAPDNYFHIRNKWHCDTRESRCDQWLDFTGSDLELYTEDNQVPWEVVTDATKPDVFYLRNRWKCEENESRCGKWVAISSSGYAYLTSTKKDRAPWSKIALPVRP